MKKKALLFASASLFFTLNASAAFSAWAQTESIEPREVSESVVARPLWLKLRAAIDERNFDEVEAVIRQNPQLLTHENAKYAATYGNPDCVRFFVELARSLELAEVCNVMPFAALSSPRAEEILARLSDCGINIGSTKMAQAFAHNQIFRMKVRNDDTPDPMDWKYVTMGSEGGWRPRASLWRMSIFETLVRHGLNVNAKEYENGVEFYPAIPEIWNNPVFFDLVAFFKTGVDPNAFVRTDIPIAPENVFSRKSLLGTAVERGDFPLVRLLVESGADVNALILGCRPEKKEFNAGNKYFLWETPLDHALLAGSTEMVRYLIAHGAKLSPKSEEQLRELLRKRQSEIESQRSRREPASKSEIARLKKLDDAIGLYHELGVFLSQKQDPKKQLETLLFVNDIPKAISFWENASAEDLPILAKSVLNYLGKNAHPELVSAVLKRVPADSESVVKAFFSQIQRGDLGGVKAFVENGVNVNATDWTNASALLEAVMCRKIEIVKFLVENGADIHSKTYPGYTPFSYAEGIRRSGGAEISDYLREVRALREREKTKERDLGK